MLNVLGISGIKKKDHVLPFLLSHQFENIDLQYYTLPCAIVNLHTFKYGLCYQTTHAWLVIVTEATRLVHFC